MSRESEKLSYHEQKRLDYLYSNYHYLNEKRAVGIQVPKKNKSEGHFKENTVSAREEFVALSSRGKTILTNYQSIHHVAGRTNPNPKKRIERK